MGKGTGLGLATVYGIIKQSQGYIWATSGPGDGTSFHIYLPCGGAVGKPADKSPAAPQVKGGDETILLVEDDDAVRKMVVSILSLYGYTIIEAGDGVEAIEIVQKKLRPEIDLLITDVIMPGMSGRDLADILQERDRSLKVRIPDLRFCPSVMRQMYLLV